jgi:unsaturated rhamnogalacturonyl hydrolase
MTYWEPAQPPNGTIGCGVVMTTRAAPKETPDQAFLQTSARRGLPVVYYAGAGWSKSGDFPDEKEWTKYVSRFARTAGH